MTQTVDRILALADALAQAAFNDQMKQESARAALLSALQEQHTALTDALTEIGNQARKVKDLTAERDAYQQAADKLAGELKALQELTVERDDLRLQVISAIGETQAAYEKMDVWFAEWELVIPKDARQAFTSMKRGEA